MINKTTTILIGFILLFGCKKTNITLLCQKNDNEKLNEIYLINNPPKERFKLDKLLFNFNKKFESYGTRTFIKPHKNSLINVVFGNKIDYKKSGCDEIDNIDLICKVTNMKLFGSINDTIIYNYYSNVSD